MTRIESELTRVDVADLGSVDSVCAEVTGKNVRLYDDGGEWTGTVTEALRRLSSLPDNAGWEAFWQAFQD